MRNTKILKPCPFCGGKANVKYNTLLPFHWEGKVYCRECKTEIKRTAVCPSNLDERLIESWNKRKFDWKEVVIQCKNYFRQETDE